MNVEDEYYESHKDIGEISPKIASHEPTHETESNNNIVTDRNLINIEDQQNPIIKFPKILEVKLSSRSLNYSDHAAKKEDDLQNEAQTPT